MQRLRPVLINKWTLVLLAGAALLAAFSYQGSVGAMYAERPASSAARMALGAPNGATPAPVSPTATLPPPNSTELVPTATATPTVCVVAFSDVPSSDPFYTMIRCLACRGVLNGYADGTFRPGNNVTRGQTAKIVANAAGYTETPTGQTFADVPLTHPFYLWVERSAAHAIIDGYTCGGPGEPCDSENRPYFRPANDVTRSQLAKIVANAAGFTEPPNGQMFADVPPTQPFYLWIARVGERQIISGYQCGGPGEPCDGLNRPYYRPYTTATRGQTAKILANTFFPNCQTP
jgi:hypothetical protein